MHNFKVRQPVPKKYIKYIQTNVKVIFKHLTIPLFSLLINNYQLINIARYVPANI